MSEVVVEAKGLQRVYSVRRGLFRAPAHLQAVGNISFKLEKGRTLDVLIAGDDAQAKTRVSEFIGSLGLRPLDVGGLNMAHWLEGTGLVLMGLARHGVGKFDIALGATEFPG